jgi:hypothetical protein
MFNPVRPHRVAPRVKQLAIARVDGGDPGGSERCGQSDRRGGAARGELLPVPSAPQGRGYAADPAMDDWSETNLEALEDMAQYLIHQEQVTLVEVV